MADRPSVDASVAAALGAQLNVIRRLVEITNATADPACARLMAAAEETTRLVLQLAEQRARQQGIGQKLGGLEG